MSGRKKTRDGFGESGLRLSFERAPIGMAVLTLSGEFLEVNPALTQMMGHDTQHLLGSNIMSLVHSDDLDDLGASWEEMANGATPVATTWMRCRTFTGDSIWGRLSLSLLPRARRQPLTVLLHLDDQTELYETLRHHASMSQGKDEFIAEIGDELRKPIREILDLTAETDGDHLDLHRTVHQIEAQARELAAIVADLVVSARADTPVTVLARSLDAGLVCEEAVAGVPEPSQVSLEIGATALWADPGIIRRILSSLLGNALRYGGATVELKTTSSGPDTVIQVIDDGPAIPNRERERIFNGDLHSGAPVTRPAVVGLSLTVARHLARQMDGEITYRRTTDRHNVFELRLPSEQYAPVELDLVPA
jgi:two-component system, sensor histidine kinase and response regulator